MKEFDKGLMIDDKYEIDSKTGTGYLGDDIYHAVDKSLDREVCIRVMPPEMMQDQEMEKRFIQGVELSASMDHPNILPAIKAGQAEGMYFFISKLEKGYRLDEYLDHREKLDEFEAVRLVADIAKALKYAWNEKKIIHRNICPETIFIARGDKPMVMDFGMAKSLESEVELTMAGFTIGNPEYMSPEQAMGGEVDFRSDIYCLGLLFYQLLSGRPPFRGDSPVELMESHLSETPPPLDSLVSGVSKKCIAVVDRMLAKKKEDRFESWDLLLTELKLLFERGADAEKEVEPRQKVKQDLEFKADEDRKYNRIVEKSKRKPAYGNERTAIIIMGVVLILLLLLVAALLLYIIFTR